ncbi:tetracycline efflux MFS transporter Tet(V) [soil metagenome]
MTRALPRLLRPLRHRDYRLLSVGMLTSLLGDGVFIVALPLQAFAISNRPSAMAVVGLVWGGSQVSMLLVGGWASDRFERRRIMIVADVVRGAAFVAVAALSLSGAIELWHLWILGAVVGTANAFFNPAVMSIVPDLLPDADLTQANAFLGTARPTMQRLLGPALGGLIVAGIGPGGAFAVNAVTFMVSAAALLALRFRPERANREQASLRQSFREVAEGFRYVKARTWCWVWLIAQSIGVLAYSGPIDMLLPFIVQNELNLDPAQAARSLGFILAVGGMGSIVASVYVGQRDLPRRFVTWMYALEAVGVAMLLVYASMTAAWMGALAALFLNGAFAYVDIAWVTTLQRRVPRELLGRVSSLDWLTALGLAPLSFVVAGPLADVFGARSVLAVGAVGGVLVVLGLFMIPGTREPEEEPVTARARAAGGAAAGGAGDAT